MKTELTKQIENSLYELTNNQATFGCFEVTIGWFGEERVDYMTYDTKGIWRCYEIKVSKSDFNSNAHNTFLGHYNYYVMPGELYEQVKEEIPEHIGVYVLGIKWKKDRLISVKRSKKSELTVDENILKNSLIRSLCRDAKKLIKSEDRDTIDSYKRQIAQAKRDYRGYYDKYWLLLREVQELYGPRWNKEQIGGGGE